MNARHFLPVAVAALLGLAGCSGSDATPEPDAAKPPAEAAKADLPIAPAPRAKADGLPPPPALSGVPRQSKPWSELIVGKWLYTGHDIVGQRTVEYTRDGKCITRYSYPAAPGRPTGIEVSTHEYRVNGNMLFPPSPYDDGTWVTESTTFIESLTENELILFSVTWTRLSLETAKQVAAARKIPVEQVLADVREEQGRYVYVRLKDKDK